MEGQKRSGETPAIAAASDPELGWLKRFRDRESASVDRRKLKKTNIAGRFVPVADPTPAEIAARSRAIRAGWSERVERLRRGRTAKIMAAQALARRLIHSTIAEPHDEAS